MYLGFSRGLEIGMRKNGMNAECLESNYHEIDSHLKFEAENFSISHLI